MERTESHQHLSLEAGYRDSMEVEQSIGPATGGERLLLTFSGSISRSSQSFMVPSIVIKGGLELASISPRRHEMNNKDQLGNPLKR